jgi:lipopolysaccharide export system protein LptA
MRTTEAARYARWSAGVAVLLAILVACVYGARDWQSRQARKKVPAAVPSSVEQRSAEFKFSKVVGNRTEFTVRASKATEFVEGGRSLLEDVWITAYGGAGERFDNLHTRTCDYLSASESISCAGDVQIELDRSSDQQAQAEKGGQASASRLVHVATSHVFFNHQTGLATTDRPVSFQFSEGEGQGVGFRYETQQGEMQLLSAVVLALHGSDSAGRGAQDGEAVLNLSGSSMTFERDRRLLHLLGPVHASQANFDLVCGKLDVELDEGMYARRLIATEQPQLQDTGPAHMTMTAETITALASHTRIETITADGRVHASAQDSTGEDQLQADRVETELDPKSNQPRELVATGNVTARSSRQGSVRNLSTSRLHLDFAPAGGGGELQVKHALTPAGTVELRDAGAPSGEPAPQRTRLSAQKLEADFSEGNELRELRGSDGVQFERQIGEAPTQSTTSREMIAHFAPGGGWSVVDQMGNVQLHQENESAQAERAHFERMSNSTLLEGSVVLTDANSKTTARTAIFDQTSNEFHAFGRVATVENSSGGSQFVNFAPGPARVSGDRLDANSTTGRAVYSGNARLWQGDSIVEGETIDLDRQKHMLTATGQVHAVFPQAQSALANPRGGARTGASKPEFWHAQGGRLTYLNDENRGHMEDKVHAHSDEGTMTADAIDFSFAPAGTWGGADPSTAAKSNRQMQTGFAPGQQLVRAAAFGSVKVEQQGRHGAASRADYTAEDGRFVLSGGTPTVYDASGNAAQGRQLTFFFGDDSINVDSAEGVRTLTLHQVEK